jgi:hypothetical protein
VPKSVVLAVSSGDFVNATPNVVSSLIMGFVVIASNDEFVCFSVKPIQSCGVLPGT